jgi:hypothetical protein
MMSKRQRWFMMRREKGGLWFDACKSQGWDFDNSDLRYDLYQQVLGRPARFKDFSNADFDLVKAHFLTLADSLKGAMEDGHPEIGEARRLVATIRSKGSPALIAHLLKQRFTFAVWLRRHHPECAGATISKGTSAKPARNPAPDWIVQEYRAAAPAAPDLEDLSEEELKQFRNTLAAHSSRQPAAPAPDPLDDNVPF